MRHGDHEHQPRPHGAARPHDREDRRREGRASSSAAARSCRGATQPAARRVIAATAARRRAPLLQLGRDFSVVHAPPATPRGGAGRGVDPPRASRARRCRPAGPTASRCRAGHQADNAAIAVVAARQLDHARPCACPTRRSPAASRRAAAGPDRGRWARGRSSSSTPPTTWRRCSRSSTTLDQCSPPIAPRALVFAASADKQIEQMLALAQRTVRPRGHHPLPTNPRAATVERLRDACRAAGLPRPRRPRHPARPCRSARSLAGTPRASSASPAASSSPLKSGAAAGRRS